MDDQNIANAKKICEEFVNAIRGHLYWQWDGGFEAALAAFSYRDRDQIRAILEGCLPNVWDRNSLSRSDYVTHQIASKFGGLKDGQLMFTSDTRQDGFLFAVWWPWDSGDRISIRVAPSALNLSESDYATLVHTLKTLLGLAT